MPGTDPLAGLPPQNAETYLGDGLYASFDGWQLALRAPRLEGDHFVALEPTVYQALREWIARYPRLRQHLILGGSLTQYGLHAAITRTAEDLADYDRATAFEQLGGKIIELPRAEWRALATAAPDRLAA